MRARRVAARPGSRRIGERQRRGHDVAVDVAARAERGGQGVVDRPDDGAHVVLGDAVELDALARREPERARGRNRSARPSRASHSPGWTSPPRDAQPDHEPVGVLLAGLAPIVALVAVVLLVAAVELEDLVAVVADVGATGGELRDQRVAQVVAVDLEPLRRPQDRQSRRQSWWRVPCRTAVVLRCGGRRSGASIGALDAEPSQGPCAPGLRRPRGSRWARRSCEPHSVQEPS